VCKIVASDIGLILKCNKLLYSVKQVALLSVQVFFCLFFVFLSLVYNGNESEAVRVRQSLVGLYCYLRCFWIVLLTKHCKNIFP